MELASMLAGERFSDHPRSVCPAIGSFLRAYNDLLDDRRRQDLYEYAARAVGTAGPEELAAARAERLVQWADDMRRRRRWVIPVLVKRFGRAPRPAGVDAASRHAVKALGTVSDESHVSALELIDELIALGSPAAVTGAPAAPAENGERAARSEPAALDSPGAAV